MRRLLAIGHADGRAEDATGHGTPGIDIAEAGGGVEGGTRGVVGEVFEAGLVGFGVSEEAGEGIAGKVGQVLGEPGAGAAFEIGGEGWLVGAQCFHAGAEAEDVECVDGEGSVAALGAAGAAGEPGAGAARGFGQRGVDDLHELGIAGGKGHSAKDSCRGGNLPGDSDADLGVG